MQAVSFSSVLSRAVFRIDDELRRRHGVFEYTTDPRSIFRMQVRSFDQAVTLTDGTHLKPGERIVDLHLWNEQLPVLKQSSLRWAKQMRECLDASLRDLNRYLSSVPHLDDVSIIRANMGFGTAQQSEQLARIAGAFGFELRPDEANLTPAQNLHRLGENILISLMVLARNRAALRGDSLRRGRVQVFLSRRVLAERYGNAIARGATAARAAS